jgi:hypothetical protein
MPYKHRKVGDKQCVYKKGDKGKKVGCTKGSIKKYLAALHANVINEDIADDLSQKYSGCLKLDIYDNNDSIILSKIFVEENCRGKEIATNVMKELGYYADMTNKEIYLTPTDDWGSNKNRLIKFYKKFNFRMTTREEKQLINYTMIREPLKLGQKRLNENEMIGGEDKIYYHGGDSEITKFSYDVEKKNRIGNVAGFYFTDIKHVALGYGKVLTQVKLHIKKPFIFGVTEPNIEMAMQFRKELISENPHIDKYSEWFDDKVQKMFQYKKLPYTDMNGMAEQRVYKAGGFDSIKDGHEIAVFDSNNIEIISSNMVNENKNKLVGGKADNLTPKDIANNFKVSVKYIKDQIKQGKKIESEHTDDTEKQTEIVMDHLSEFPDYYKRIKKMEKEAKKHWGEKLNLNETKVLIKNLLRENLIPSLKGDIKDQLYNQMEKLGIEPNEVTNITINGKEVNLHNNEGPIDTVKKFGLACSLVAGMLSCQKEEPVISINSRVSRTEYKINNSENDDNVMNLTVSNFQDKPVEYRVNKDGKKLFGFASHGLAVKEKFTEEQYFIYAYGQSIDEEERANREHPSVKNNDGESVYDFKPEKYSSDEGLDYSHVAFKRISVTPTFKLAVSHLRDNKNAQIKFDKEAEEYGLPNLKASDVISGKYN